MARGLQDKKFLISDLRYTWCILYYYTGLTIKVKNNCRLPPRRDNESGNGLVTFFSEMSRISRVNMSKDKFKQRSFDKTN